MISSIEFFLSVFGVGLCCSIVVAAVLWGRYRQNALWKWIKGRPFISKMLSRLEVQRKEKDRLRRLEWLKSIRQLLVPVELQGVELSRFGNASGDGGYLIAGSEPACDVLLSYGILDDVSFELDYVRRFLGARVHLFDHTIERLPSEHPSFVFHREGLGPRKTFELGTIQDHVDRYSDSGQTIFLKIDVEGAEYDSLLAANPGVFEKVQQIAIELHSVCWPNDDVVRLLRRLTSDFYVIHIHGNNSGGMTVTEIGNIPAVLEVTLLRKTGKRVISAVKTLPHRFDRPNDPSVDEINVGSIFFAN